MTFLTYTISFKIIHLYYYYTHGKLNFNWWLMHPLTRGVTGIFFWGGNVIFPDFLPGVKCFFPVENSHFGRPKTNFRRFQKWKAKKKKKKKKSSHFFYNFSYFHFQYSTFPFYNFYNFPSFLLIFTPFHQLFPFSPICQQKFPSEKSLGGTLSPARPPSCYATASYVYV